ncbi:TolC family protein [Flavitalea flava]
MSRILIVIAIVIGPLSVEAQRLGLDSILNNIQRANPLGKMYDNDIRSMDETAKGARSWMAPELGTGFWMTPYNPSLWKKAPDGTSGMGQYMVSAQQMFPNRKRQDADAAYMGAMSSVEKEKKKASLNELYAVAKRNYYDWMTLRRKLGVIDRDEHLLEFMIQNAEIRYKNGMGKLSAYYKAKAALANLGNMRSMLENEIKQKRIALNTLMNRDKLREFDIDTSYTIRDYTALRFDSTLLAGARSDIKAIDRNITLTQLQRNAELAKLKPEYGVRYEHMFGFGGLPMQFTLMGMVKIPFARWSSKMYRANAESLKWKTESLVQQKQMMINEASGMAYGMQTDIETKKKQVGMFQNNIIPALERNYQAMQLGYEQNTEELFMLLDAWETLNMTQLEYLNQLQELLEMQVELERILEIK